MASAIIKVEFKLGDNIYESIDEAIRLANLLNVTIDFNFNDVSFYISKDSERAKCIEIYKNYFK